MALAAVTQKNGMGGSNGGRGRSDKTAVYKAAGRKYRRQESRRLSRSAISE